MHIPDGYLGPQTYVPLYAVFVGFLAAAIRKLRRSLSSRTVPYLGMAAAFSFLIMMFNVPIPGGTTGHAVGASIVTLILGPWAAMVAVSVALIIQAFLFGDGGITAIGANCVNMAVVMPFVTLGVFRLVQGKARSGWRIYLAAFLSGYIGLVVAAVVTAIQFGIQPIIASEGGKPLYAPYGLEVAIPAMAIEHLVLFGIIEGLVTLIVFRVFIKRDPDSVYVMKEKAK